MYGELFVSTDSILHNKTPNFRPQIFMTSPVFISTYRPHLS